MQIVVTEKALVGTDVYPVEKTGGEPDLWGIQLIDSTGRQYAATSCTKAESAKLLLALLRKERNLPAGLITKTEGMAIIGSHLHHVSEFGGDDTDADIWSIDLVDHNGASHMQASCWTAQDAERIAMLLNNQQATCI